MLNLCLLDWSSTFLTLKCSRPTPNSSAVPLSGGLEQLHQALNIVYAKSCIGNPIKDEIQINMRHLCCTAKYKCSVRGPSFPPLQPHPYASAPLMYHITLHAPLPPLSDPARFMRAPGIYSADTLYLTTTGPEWPLHLLPRKLTGSNTSVRFSIGQKAYLQLK